MGRGRAALPTELPPGRPCRGPASSARCSLPEDAQARGPQAHTSPQAPRATASAPLPPAAATAPRCRPPGETLAGPPLPSRHRAGRWRRPGLQAQSAASCPPKPGTAAPTRPVGTWPVAAAGGQRGGAGAPAGSPEGTQEGAQGEASSSRPRAGSQGATAKRRGHMHAGQVTVGPARRSWEPHPGRPGGQDGRLTGAQCAPDRLAAPGRPPGP